MTAQESFRVRIKINYLIFRAIRLESCLIDAMMSRASEEAIIAS